MRRQTAPKPYIYISLFYIHCIAICRRVRQRDAKSRYLTPFKGMHFVDFGPQGSHQKQAICPITQVVLAKTTPKNQVKQRDPPRTKNHTENDPKFFCDFGPVMSLMRVPSFNADTTLKFRRGVFLRNLYVCRVFFPPPFPHFVRSKQVP